MKNYYSDFLNSNNLKKCYEIAPPRVKRFLEAEIEFVMKKINRTDTALDLGCGYGRVSSELLKKAKRVVGIDITPENIELARKTFLDKENCEFHVMNAIDLKFPDNDFDIVICVQNGISAFKEKSHRTNERINQGCTKRRNGSLFNLLGKILGRKA